MGKTITKNSSIEETKDVDIVAANEETKDVVKESTTDNVDNIQRVLEKLSEKDSYDRIIHKDDMRRLLKGLYEIKKGDYTTGYMIVKDVNHSSEVDLDLETSYSLSYAFDVVLKLWDICFFNLVAITNKDSLRYVSIHPKSADLIECLKKQITNLAIWGNRMRLSGSKKIARKVEESQRLLLDSRQSSWKVSNTQSVSWFVALNLLLKGNEKNTTGVEEESQEASELF